MYPASFVQFLVLSALPLAAFCSRKEPSSSSDPSEEYETISLVMNTATTTRYCGSQPTGETITIDMDEDESIDLDVSLEDNFSNPNDQIEPYYSIDLDDDMLVEEEDTIIGNQYSQYIFDVVYNSVIPPFDLEIEESESAVPAQEDVIDDESDEIEASNNLLFLKDRAQDLDCVETILAMAHLVKRKSPRPAKPTRGIRKPKSKNFRKQTSRKSKTDYYLTLLREVMSKYGKGSPASDVLMVAAVGKELHRTAVDILPLIQSRLTSSSRESELMLDYLTALSGKVPNDFYINDVDVEGLSRKGQAGVMTALVRWLYRAVAGPKVSKKLSLTDMANAVAQMADMVFARELDFQN